MKARPGSSLGAAYGHIQGARNGTSSLTFHTLNDKHKKHLQKTGRHTSMGFNEPNYAGVGMLTEVKAQNRPVTREGLSGIRVKTAGLGRRVQDSSYYLGLVRSKISELNAEIKIISSSLACLAQ